MLRSLVGSEMCIRDRCQEKCFADFGSGCRAIEWKWKDCRTFTDGECCTDACRKQAACTATGCLSTDHPRICPYTEELIGSQCTAERSCLKTPAGWFDGPGWTMWFYMDLDDYDRDGIADALDQCPGTPRGRKVDWTGCNYDNTLTIQAHSPSSAHGPAAGLLDGDSDSFWNCCASNVLEVGSVFALKGGGGKHKYYCRDYGSSVKCDSTELTPTEMFTVQLAEGREWPRMTLWGGYQNHQAEACGYRDNHMVCNEQTPVVPRDTWQITELDEPGMVSLSRHGGAHCVDLPEGVACPPDHSEVGREATFQLECLEGCKGGGQKTDLGANPAFVTFDSGCPLGVESGSFTLKPYLKHASPKQFRLSAGSTPEATDCEQTFNQPAPWDSENSKKFDMDQACRGRYWRLVLLSSHGADAFCPKIGGFALAACPQNVCKCLWDSDNDGVVDEDDQCPNSPAGQAVDKTGCEQAAPKFSGFCVALNGAAIGSHRLLADAKEQLAGIWVGWEWQDLGVFRMIFEVTDGVVNRDPETIAGQAQSTANGFNKYWGNGDEFDQCSAACQQYYNANPY
eukprot:TRINITY_DN13899_c0_g1_i9.p1 TRINITY_DN13899_c0_g1~~TRINITY_DN13899_c0_g1_i9.p1  ORF type:complete len:599 (+),score=93.87 TRINITY_DN13899_c0_g1_i9:94-1797(+)